MPFYHSSSSHVLFQARVVFLSIPSCILVKRSQAFKKGKKCASDANLISYLVNILPLYYWKI